MIRLLALASAGVFLWAGAAEAQTVRVYGMRGLFGGVAAYSWGVDEAVKKIVKATGGSGVVSPWWRSQQIAAQAIADYRKSKRPVILVGHSMGADRISSVAAQLERAGVPVAAALYYDPTPTVRCVPRNVKVAVSWRRTAPLNLGGGYIRSCSGAKLQNINVRTTHTALDDHPQVHAGSVRIAQEAVK
jgi:pimeloyl-ACP methyl ester carboxylesterase